MLQCLANAHAIDIIKNSVVTAIIEIFFMDLWFPPCVVAPFSIVVVMKCKKNSYIFTYSDNAKCQEFKRKYINFATVRGREGFQAPAFLIAVKVKVT